LTKHSRAKTLSVIYTRDRYISLFLIYSIPFDKVNNKKCKPPLITSRKAVASNQTSTVNLKQKYGIDHFNQFMLTL